MDDFKTWYEKKHGVPNPARCDERTHLVFQRLADSFAEWSQEWAVEMANLMKPPQMIIPFHLQKSEADYSAALEDAARHGAGFLRIKPDGSAERVAPEDWQAGPEDLRHTHTAFNCGSCFKTRWFFAHGEEAILLARGAGWVLEDGLGWFCSEKCRKAETGEGAE